MSSDCSFLRVCVSPAYRLLLEALLVRFLALHLRELRDFLLLEDLPLVFHNLDLFFFQHFHARLLEGFGDEHREDRLHLDVEVEQVVLGDDLCSHVDQVRVSRLFSPSD